MAMERFSFSFGCPVKSARRRGRRPASNCTSSAWRSPEISSRSGIVLPAYRTSSSARRKSGSNSAAAPAALALRTAAFRLRPARSPGSAAPRARPDRPARASARQPALPGSSPVGRRQFVAQFQHHALRGLLADARDAHQLLHFAAADRADQVGRRHAGENLHRQRRPDAAHPDQLFEQRLSRPGSGSRTAPARLRGRGCGSRRRTSAPASGSCVKVDTGMVTS